MKITLSVSIRDTANAVLGYCSEKYKCSKDDLIDEAILEFYFDDKIELLENMRDEYISK